MPRPWRRSAKLHRAAARSIPGWWRASATYGLELFRAVPDLDTVYVPIGLGSGICGTIAARNALGLKTKIVGVVAENAAAYALSFAKRAPVSTNSADTMADGMACRVPDEAALAIIFGACRARDHRQRGRDQGGDAALLHGHAQCRRRRRRRAAGGAAEGARTRWQGKRVALVLSGGNIDREKYAGVLQATGPSA